MESYFKEFKRDVDEPKWFAVALRNREVDYWNYVNPKFEAGKVVSPWIMITRDEPDTIVTNGRERTGGLSGFWSRIRYEDLLFWRHWNSYEEFICDLQTGEPFKVLNRAIDSLEKTREYAEKFVSHEEIDSIGGNNAQNEA